MASTKLKPVKTNLKYTIDYTTDKEKTSKDIKQTIAYIDNEVKNNGQYVTGLHCTPKVADLQFKAVKQKYNKTDKNLGYHVIQSFAPGEVSPYKAHMIGKELAKRLTKDRHQAVISTHTDKAHIHNHIVFNSVSFVDGKKWYNRIFSYKLVRKLSDELCKEHGLSIINPKNEKAMHYKEWMENKKGTSWKAHIKEDINSTIKESSTWIEYLDKMRAKGYEIKQGKYTSYRPKNKDRFVRCRTLGFDYTKDSIAVRIKLHKHNIKIPKDKFKVKSYNPIRIKHKSLLTLNIALFITLLRELRNRGSRYNYTKKDYSYNATIIKQLSNMLVIARNENIDTLQKVKDKIENNKNQIRDLTNKIKQNEYNKIEDKSSIKQYMQLKEKDKIYKKLKLTIEEATKEIQKTNKPKNKEKQIKKDLGLTR